MNAKSTKKAGTETTTKGTLAKTQAKAAKRTAKTAAKDSGVRKADKDAPAGGGVSMEHKVANAGGDELATTPAPGKKGKRVPWRERAAVLNAENNEKFAAGQIDPPAANPLLTARGPEFTDALNAASVPQLEEALKHPGLSNQYRNRIGIALKLRTTPADDVAKIVDAVAKGDLTKDIEVPTAGKKKATPRAAKPDGKMSGLDAASKVLAEASQPMNAKQVVEAMKAKGYWSSCAATPHATIYSAIITEIPKKDSQARFKKTGRGMFTITAADKQAK